MKKTKEKTRKVTQTMRTGFQQQQQAELGLVTASLATQI